MYFYIWNKFLIKIRKDSGYAFKNFATREFWTKHKY